MSTEEVRTDAAAALRDLNHAFAAHDPDDDQLRDIAREARAARRADSRRTPRRDRLALMRGRASTPAGFR